MFRFPGCYGLEVQNFRILDFVGLSSWGACWVWDRRRDLWYFADSRELWFVGIRGVDFGLGNAGTRVSVGCWWVAGGVSLPFGTGRLLDFQSV